MEKEKKRKLLLCSKSKWKRVKKHYMEIKFLWKQELQDRHETCTAAQQSTFWGWNVDEKTAGWGGGGGRGGGGYGTVSVRLSTLQWGKMQAIYLDRFPFKAGAPRGCKNRVRGSQGGVEGWKGRGATPASFQTAQQKVSASAWLKPPHCQVKSVEELILGSVGFVKHWLWTGICSLSAFFFFKYKLLSQRENVFFPPFSLKPSKET